MARYESITGEVEKFFDGKVIFIDGDRYSAWNKSQVPSELEVGDEVSFNWVAKGDWRNIKGDVEITSQGGGGQTEGNKSSGNKETTANQQTLRREHALGRASEMVAAMTTVSTAEEFKERLVLTLYAAKLFDSFNAGTLDLPTAIKKLRGEEVETPKAKPKPKPEPEPEPEEEPFDDELGDVLGELAI